METHLINILPITTLQSDTMFHRHFLKQPSYSHLRVFGCLLFPYIVTHTVSPKSTQCTFLGYPTNRKGYWRLNIHTKQIILSRHVIFDKSVFSFGSMTLNSPPFYSFLDHVTSSPIVMSPPSWQLVLLRDKISSRYYLSISASTHQHKLLICCVSFGFCFDISDISYVTNEGCRK